MTTVEIALEISLCLVVLARVFNGKCLANQVLDILTSATNRFY